MEEESMKAPQTVVVTGASAGVGRAVARQFATRGARVALLARGEAGLAATARDVQSLGGQALVVPTDVADYSQVEDAAQRVEEHWGPIDIWINDAFASVFAPFHEIPMDEYHRVSEVCYLGYVHGTKAALGRMRQRDHGTIVQVGSALGLRAIPLQSAYCAAKHAINGFTESVRTELLHEHSNVHITIAQLPALNTPQFGWVLNRLPRHPQPVPPIYQPEVAARAVVHAAEHPRRKQYWVGSSTVATIVGQKLMPALLDRYLAATGYQSQQTSRTEHERLTNLFEPLDGADGADRGAHGAFDDSSHSTDPQLWCSQHPVAATAAVAGLLTAAWSARRQVARGSNHQ
jgi:NAD(P)-dependent dehydrogenase (short-subunit alcohol dehydrogenase family)